MERSVIFFSLLLLSACSSYMDSVNPEAMATAHGCAFVNAHYKQNGDHVSGHYRCPDSTPRAFLTSNHCYWVNSYYREDGGYVSGYQRCNMFRYTAP